MLAVLEAIAAVFAVILDVFEVTLVSSAVMLEVLDDILVLNASSAFVALVISAAMLAGLALTLFVNTNSAA